jgi:hypothetical protein
MHVWADGGRDGRRAWCDRIRRRRNAIHAYRDCDIGTFADLEADIRAYREFLNDLNLAVPYPDEHPQFDLRLAEQASLSPEEAGRVTP